MKYQSLHETKLGSTYYTNLMCYDSTTSSFYLYLNFLVCVYYVVAVIILFKQNEQN